PWFLANPPSSNLESDLSFWLRNGANSRPNLDPWVIPLMASCWPESKSFSPTSLELFNRCAFRFFAEKTLRLFTPSEKRLALAWGTMIHEALERATVSRDKLPYDEKRLKEQLKEALASHHVYLDPFHTHQVQRMVGILCRGKWTEKVEGFTQLEAEHTFQNTLLGVDPRGRNVLLSGRIDLLAIHKELNVIAILDFKTGRIENIQKKIDSKRLLQPGLYASYFRALPAAENKIVTVGYLFLDKKDAKLTGAKNFPGQKRGGFDLNMTENEDGLTEPQRVAIDSAHAIREGTISLTVHGPDKPDSECTPYCPSRHACRHPSTYKSR
ncbi:MAG: PD-(D/E)XK nuclease family protein, partial [Gemmataceae bacterium]